MASGKNTHLEHIEDEIINNGTEGGKQAIKILKEMLTYLSGKPGPGMAVTTKYDGAPAIICGIDPSDGKFFVGTKSVFAKTAPKLVKSVSDARTMYDGVLAEKLASSFVYLKNAGIKGECSAIWDRFVVTFELQGSGVNETAPCLYDRDVATLGKLSQPSCQV